MIWILEKDVNVKEHLGQLGLKWLLNIPVSLQKMS